jgi:hypothetical protein
MMLGKYGIGILGFWGVGRELEVRTRVAGSEVWQLRLLRDEPLAEVRRAKQGRMPFDGETWTEVIIRGVHPGPARQLSARRLGEYLGAELRGQLLARDLRLRMVDRLARSSALKDFLVVPHRFRGRRLGELGELPVPGHACAMIELYLVDSDADRRAVVSLSCGGAVVCDDLGALDGYGLDSKLWASGCLEGVVEFPALDVAPSTRRGFAPSPSAEALFAALRGVEPALCRILEAERSRLRDEEDAHLAREIRNAFRPLVRMLPQYDFFDITARGRGGDRHREPPGEQLGSGSAAVSLQDPAQGEPELDEDDTAAQPHLFAGPLHAVRIVPSKCRMLPGATRTLLARAVDEQGHRIDRGIEFMWQIAEGDGALGPVGSPPQQAADVAREPDKHGSTAWVSPEPRVGFRAGESLGVVRLRLSARQAKNVGEGEARIEIVDKLAGDSPDAGIPDPKRVFDPAGDWRSRVLENHWEYNAAHPDYRAVAADSKQRLRYLVHVFAKEIVLHNYGEPKDDRLLERMVEVLTHIKPRG